jgi:hypothetical protein
LNAGVSGIISDSREVLDLIRSREREAAG